MSSVNKVILIGHLGRDPETRRLANGDPVVNMRIATGENWTDKQTGERRSKTEWHSVVIFNENLARVAEQYLRKGSKVYLEGQLQTREWTDKDNVKRYSTEIVLQRYRGAITLLDGKSDRDDAAAEESAPREDKSNSYEAAKNGTRPPKSDLDDDIPF
ncbi:MAG: single-stranded DNA-binding protein [Pseudomonadota bacterium]